MPDIIKPRFIDIEIRYHKTYLRGEGFTNDFRDKTNNDASKCLKHQRCSGHVVIWDQTGFGKEFCSV